MTTLLDLLKGAEAALGSDYTKDGYDADSIRPVVRIVQRCFDEIAGPGTFVVRMIWDRHEPGYGFTGDSELIAFDCVGDQLLCWYVVTPFNGEVTNEDVLNCIQNIAYHREDDPNFSVYTPFVRDDGHNSTWADEEDTTDEDPAPAAPPLTGAYFLHPECGRDDRWGPVLGPFPNYLQITYREIRNGAEEMIAWLGDDGDWHIDGDDHPYSDIVIWHEGVGLHGVIEDGKFVIFKQAK